MRAPNAPKPGLPAQATLPDFDRLPVLRPDELEAIEAKTRETLGELLAQDTLAPATVRSYASAMRYWDAWYRASTGDPLPLLATPRQPVPTETVCAFIAHHAPEQVGDEYRMAMPAPVHGRMRQLEAIGHRQTRRRNARMHEDVPTLATVKHRIAALSACHRLAGLDPPFADDSRVRQALRALGNRASKTARAMLRQPKKPVSRELFEAMLADCRTDGLRGLRDAALLHVAFHTGGRRRSELAGMRWPDLVPHALPQPIEGVRDGYLWTLHEMKGKRAERADQGVAQFPILGDAADAFDRWRDVVLAHGKPADGPVWYRLTANGRNGRTAKAPEGEGAGLRLSTPMTGSDVWRVVKYRAAAVGLDPDDFGAHSLRSGGATTLLLEGASLDEASKLLGHAKLETTRAYYDHRGVPQDALARHVARNRKS